MEFKVSNENREKIKFIAIPTGVILFFYLFFQYIFPLIWPLAISAGLALFVYPVVHFFDTKLHINKIVCTILLLIVMTLLVGWGLTFVVQKLVVQLQLFSENFDYYGQCIHVAVADMCEKIEVTLGMSDGVVFEAVDQGISGFFEKLNQTIMQFVIGVSIPAVKTVIDAIVAGAIIIVAFFLMIKDMDKIKENAKHTPFGKELSFFYRRFMVALKAYLRAQIILMLIVAAISILGLTIAKNSYAWLLGICVGILDALPLFGSGIILVPLTLFAILGKKFVQAAIIFTTFIVCYFLREFLEPKLMGDKIGVGALTTLIGIYAGYQLFGFLGMFAGILVVIVISDLYCFIISQPEKP